MNANKCRVLICIQARINSTRLPKKIFLPLGGRMVLEQILRRCQSAKIENCKTAVCVPYADEVEVYERTGIVPIVGPEKDVLTRLLKACDIYDPGRLVRVTGDCPLVCPRLLEYMYAIHVDRSNKFTVNWRPRSYPNGLDLEIYDVEWLRSLSKTITNEDDREWFTQWIMEDHGSVVSNVQNIDTLSHMRWTLDYPEDYEFMKAVYAAMGDEIWDAYEIAKWLDAHPKVSKLNRKYNKEFGSRPE